MRKLREETGINIHCYFGGSFIREIFKNVTSNKSNSLNNGFIDTIEGIKKLCFLCDNGEVIDVDTTNLLSITVAIRLNNSYIHTDNVIESSIFNNIFRMTIKKISLYTDDMNKVYQYINKALFLSNIIGKE